jgi:hypothetical protein
MSSIPSLNPALSNLLQTLSNVNSPVLSSPTAVSALESASPGDIVQLSMAATQLENVDILFGVASGSSGNSSSDLNSLLANLEPSLTGSSSSSAVPVSSTNSQSSSASSPIGSASDQIANYQAALQAEEIGALLGPSSTGSASNSLLDAIG